MADGNVQGTAGTAGNGTKSSENFNLRILSACADKTISLLQTSVTNSDATKSSSNSNIIRRTGCLLAEGSFGSADGVGGQGGIGLITATNGGGKENLNQKFLTVFIGDQGGRLYAVEVGC